MQLNLTPDPRILVALTHNPLAPLDALCELIDNALDSFADARLGGKPIEFPLVAVQLPGPGDIRHGVGSLVVRDNGPGLTPAGAEKALRAGFSGKTSRSGRLGLFGMGFNVATGKIGQRTRFLTAVATEQFAVEVLVDLLRMQSEQSYMVPAELVAKPADFTQGTQVEVTAWWPDGNPNHGFIKKLAGYGTETVVKELGRRYATILRDHNVRILINGIPCRPFEHCTWDRKRFVERRGLGQIPAKFEFNEVLATQVRCVECDTLIAEGTAKCPRCESSSARTIEERVRGWIGIQRFDDPADFGIDVIRNGRAIRIGEKDAFFTFVDEFKRETKDYPIDNPFGRIVGEIHLDHVPVDFLKQDFQRSSDEWRRAMSYVRGDSSLQPGKANAESNTSPLFKLYQGYRRVRNCGTADLYMGVWDEEKGCPKRISRDVEKEYYRKFLDRIPGYYDDAEWWAQVELASQPPAPKLAECTACSAQNLQEADVCQVCGFVLRGQPCVSCAATIPVSAASCPHCGVSQIPEINEPWRCAVCTQANSESEDVCMRCGKPRGALSPSSREFLLANSTRNDDLSIMGLSVTLADGSSSQPIDIDVFDATMPLTPLWQGKPVPLLAFKGEHIECFLDHAHTIFRSYRIRAEVMIAAEVAQYLYDLNRSQLQTAAKATHSVSNLAWLCMTKYWSDTLEDSSERVRLDIERFFADVRAELPRLAVDVAEELFGNLNIDDQRALTNNILAEGQDLTRLAEWRESGEFLRYVDPATIVKVFRAVPEIFFDNGVWTQAYANMPGGLQPAVIEHVQNEIKTQYLNCLEDCAAYLRYTRPEPLVSQRARISLTFLNQKVG